MRGDAGALHDRSIEPVARVEVLEIERPAVVLGSTQSHDMVDMQQAAALGFDVVRRRSGGGVVILQPEDHAWVDVTVPRGHQLWLDDVERATWWLGEAWCRTLAATDGEAVWAVHRERLTASGVDRSVCFAALGPGEVTRGGRKVVGISQRRTKDAARFQCVIFRTIDLPLHAHLLRDPLPASLESAVGVGEQVSTVRDHFVATAQRALSGRIGE